MGIKIYLDGADLDTIEKLIDRVDGVTTNPSILRKAGIKDYRTFAKTVLSLVKGKPVSFEVLSDDWDEMERQANEIQLWGDNIFVKVPIVNTKGELSVHMFHRLKHLNLNITAVMTRDQAIYALHWLKPTDILSVFVGRITDTGVSAVQAVCHALSYEHFTGKKAQILWASAREIYNYYEAENLGVDIITLSPELIAKLSLRGKDLTEYSRETVQQFHDDGKGLTI